MQNLPSKNRQGKCQIHGRKYRGQPSHAIPVWNGILEHRERIGPAIWEFLWCLDKITTEDENGIGWLLGKTPIDTKRIAADLGEHPDTAYGNLNRLAAEAYILRKRTPRGYSIGVVNSRKFQAFRSKSDSEEIPNHRESDSEKIPNQAVGDSEKTPRVIRGFPESDSEKTPIRRDTTETLQEDSTEKRDRTPVHPSSSSALQPPFDDESLYENNPLLLEWARKRILDRARHEILDSQAYLYRALPRFLENLPAEIEGYLTDRLRAYVDSCIWDCPDLPLSFRELDNFLECVCDENNLPIDPADSGLTDRIFAAVQQERADSLVIAELGYLASEKHRAYRHTQTKYPIRGWLPYRTYMSAYHLNPPLPAAS